MEDQNIHSLLYAGEHWKAKEKLQGQLAQPGYDSALFEKYGYVLLKMNDKLEAGKYLFLSGIRNQEYAESIQLYLNRYAGKDSNYFFHTFPKKAQHAPFTDYPPQVLSDLEKLDIKMEEINRTVKSPPHSETLKDRIVDFGCSAAFFIFVLLFFVGVGSGVKILWGLIW